MNFKKSLSSGPSTRPTPVDIGGGGLTAAPLHVLTRSRSGEHREVLPTVRTDLVIDGLIHEYKNGLSGFKRISEYVRFFRSIPDVDYADRSGCTISASCGVDAAVLDPVGASIRGDLDGSESATATSAREGGLSSTATSGAIT